MKKRTRSKVVKELDRVFSLYIRQRDANLDGFVECFTCGRSNHWKKLQCGHFMSRSRYATRWDEINCQNQCPKCNLFNQGEQYKFSQQLDEKHGLGTAEALQISSLQTVKYMTYELEEMIDEYKKKLEELK